MKQVSFLLTSVCMLALASGAPAQSKEIVEEEKASALDTIYVTARRKEENLQAIPLSVQSFDGETLSRRNVDNATDLTKIVPALTSAQSSRDEENYVMRGQSGSGASITGQQVTVAAYFSEVPLPIGDGGGAGRYFDLENVQVLKGPQGTLFGRNATGGAVLFQPRLPGDEYGGYLQAEYGNYDHMAIEGAIDLPFSDIFKLRVSGRAHQRNGFTENATVGGTQDNREYWAGRVSAIFTPHEKINNTLVFDILDRDNNGSSNHITLVNSNAGIPRALGGAVEAALDAKIAAGPYVSLTDSPTVNILKSWGIANKTEFEIADNLTLKNIFGFRRLRQINRWDFDGSSLPLLHFDTCATEALCNTMATGEPWGISIRQITEELQLTGTLLDDRLDFTIGGFYLTTKSPDANYIHRSIGVFGLNTDINQFIDDTSKAVYGQATLDLSDWLLDGLKATAGYRYSDDERSVEISQVDNGRCTTGDVGAPAPDPSTSFNCLQSVSAPATSDSYTFGLDYHVTDDVMVYATHRRSYRAGGYNPLAGPALTAMPPIPNAAGLFAYAPEIVTDWEIGLKGDWSLGGMDVRTNIALYTSNLDDAQLNQTFTGGGGVTVSAVTNAATAEVRGVDVDAIFVPNEFIEVIAGWSHTDAEYGQFEDYTRRDPVTGEPSLQSGRIFPFTPKNKVNVALILNAPLDDSLGDLSASLNWAHKSSMILGLVPFITLPDGSNVFDGESSQGASNTLDLDVSWANVGGSSVDANFFVTNLTDTTYKIAGASLVNSGLGFNQRIYNEPRMYGFRLRYNFGG
ncbi:TonB-dependent receptor [Hyphococcus sp. DH-69]|uniref:TonB-dependent receptor n=1 Tax=Hyphococcus formosus TaxID=3143534 RepID=UPI00398B9E04